jgi:chemotaxis protein CheZ
MSDPDRLEQRLAEIRTRHPGSQPEIVAEVVHAVLATMSGDLSAHETSLLAEVEALGHTIACAKAEIAALRVDDITDNHIPFATDELDAIVEHTATATNAILSSCETLDDVAGSLAGEPAAKLQDATTRIYEACSFQDIISIYLPRLINIYLRFKISLFPSLTFANLDSHRLLSLMITKCYP